MKLKAAAKPMRTSADTTAPLRPIPRREDLVYDRCGRAHRLHFSWWKGLIDPEPRPDYGLFSLWRSSKRTRDLPADSLRHTQLAIERGQEANV